MFTRMTEIQALNTVSFNKMFASELEWETVKPPVIFSEEDIDEAKERFNIGDNEYWSMWTVFGYDMVISCHKKTSCIQFKLIDPDFGSLLCIPSRMIKPNSNWSFKLSVARDEDTDSLVFHVQVVLEKDDGDDVELFSKYVVLNNIE